MLFCCLKGSYDVIKRIIVPPSFIAYTFFGSVLRIFSPWRRVWRRVWSFRGAWTSFYFYKEYLFGFETLVFATSGILSMHEQLVTLQRERKTWNMTPLRNILCIYIYIYIYIYILLLFCLSKMCSRSEGKHTLFVSVPVEAWYWRAVPQPTVWTHWFGHLALSTSSVLTAMDRWVTVAMW